MATRVSRKRKPVVKVVKNGPYMITGLEHLKDAEGKELPVQPVIALCRCGASKNKPYCDGSHAKIGFNGEKDPNRIPGEINEWKGKRITIVDNPGICSRDKSCVNCLPQVFAEENPDAATIKEIIDIIRKCPSGALSYKMGGRHCQGFNRQPAIALSKNGPLKVVGGIRLQDETGSKPVCAEHYTLCRCGHSRNKPFCDGSHLDVDFRDDAGSST